MNSKLLIITISLFCTLQLNAKDLNKKEAPTLVPIDTLIFEDGSRYIGYVTDSLFNGYGMMLYSDSTYYEGEWKDGLWNGYGFIKFPGGDTYQGTFVNHAIEGEGIYSYSNGANYEGNWKNNMFDGVGTLKYSDGGYYSGEWKEDKRHGFGVMYSVPDSSLYSGIFEDDMYLGGEETDYKVYDNYENDTWQEYQYSSKWNVNITYGSNSLIGLSVSYDQEKIFFGGTMSINAKEHCRGEKTRYHDDDDELVVLAKWNEYKIDEIGENKYTLANFMANIGCKITEKWDCGVSAGFGLNRKYKNCITQDDPNSCPSFDIGELYYKTKFGGLCFSYGVFTRCYIPYLDDLDFLINMGISNIEGVFFGFGLRF